MMVLCTVNVLGFDLFAPNPSTPGWTRSFEAEAGPSARRSPFRVRPLERCEA